MWRMRLAMIVSGAAVGAGTGAVCVAYDLEGTGLLVVATLWIACGVSWERAIGGKGILGGGIGGIIGGLAMAGLIMFCHPADFDMVGSLIFFYSVAWWLPLGAGLGLNVWLYLGKPFLRENAAGIMGVLQRAESWAAIGLFSTSVLFTASALLVAMSCNGKLGQPRRKAICRPVSEFASAIPTAWPRSSVKLAGFETLPFTLWSSQLHKQE
jgi:hypothetical protein